MLLSPSTNCITMNNYSTTIATSSENGTFLKLDLIGLKKSALILRAINHKLRQQIMKLINDNEKITVTEIYIQLRLEQSVASQHLAILRRAGFVKLTEKENLFTIQSMHTGSKK